MIAISPLTELKWQESRQFRNREYSCLGEKIDIIGINFIIR